MDISFFPDNLELAYRERGSFNITIKNSNDHKVYVRIVHFATKSGEGSSTRIEPDLFEVPAGGTNTSRVTVRSNSRGLEGAGASDVHLAFNWSTVVDDDFTREDWFDPKWEHTYDIVDLTDARSEAYMNVLVAFVVAFAVVLLVFLYLRFRHPSPKRENN